ncbi:hypothetical protein WJX73_006359 [Symbiochloris irregularis]|uniref:DUF659 domain-containing protein n=1 Tax=Symbiochloris irregularis TaxID=706552 RepID=A0AAW1NPW0_9CHLO
MLKNRGLEAHLGRVVVCEGDKGRSSAFYDAQDFSEEHHTGEFIAEAIYEWALKIGPQKLVAVITDNAPAMVKARRLFVEKEGMGHIIPIRCHMHGVNLCLEGVLVGEFAKNISSQGQVVATFIRASPIAAAKGGCSNSENTPSAATRLQGASECADAEEAHTGSHLIEHPGVKAKAHHDQ